MIGSVSIGVVGAFLGGILSLISPCSALLLPAFFAAAFTSRRLLLGRITVFWLGLCSLLVPLGMGVGAVGSIVTVHRELLIAVGGISMIIFGVIAATGNGFSVPVLHRLAASKWVKGTGVVPIFLLGCVYGFAGLCAGPLLGAVLVTATVSGTSMYGAAIMACYALGMTIPLFVLAIIWDRYDIGSSRWLRGKAINLGPISTSTTAVAGGGVFILIGLLFIFSSGTTGLAPLVSLDTQVAAQQAIVSWLAGISTAQTALLVLVAVAVGWGGYLMVPKKRH